MVVAGGPVIVGFGEGDEGQKLTRGRIWGGGRCRVPRPFHLVLNPNQQQARIAANVATRINEAFQTAGFGPASEVARAENNVIVVLTPPAQYRLNLPRFLRVVRMVPLEDFSAEAAGDGPAVPYRSRVADDLLDPARAVVAALRLEALGTDSVPALKVGLENESPLVRFCAAESLAYLGSPSCGEELARVVRQQPYLRAYALTALASLDEAVCNVKLKELLHEDLDDEVRYGAFRALRTMDDREPAVAGERLGETFSLHTVPGGSKPFVHVSVARRPEIVFFGESPRLVPPFSIVAGEFTITAGADDVDRCVVSHYPLHRGGTGGKVRCSLEVAEVVKAMAGRGASYPEVLELLRQADGCRNLSCRVRHDALPQAARVEEIARAGRQKLEEDGKPRPENEVALIKPDSDFGATPTLFEVTAGRRKPSEAERALLRESPNKDSRATAERK
jgi:hypothetical protein